MYAAIDGRVKRAKRKHSSETWMPPSQIMTATMLMRVVCLKSLRGAASTLSSLPRLLLMSLLKNAMMQPEGASQAVPIEG